MSEDFKSQLIEHAKVVVDRAERAETEAATQQFLIMPLFQLLGYNPLNPDEIVPEAHASFSTKHRNRVDYAIYKEQEPVIAIECKKVGSLSDANRGELKGYFNAVPTVKLGILTDGLVYQLFSDTSRENMMDDEPFVSVDLAEVAEDRISENAFDAFLKLRKETFDPADVGADAQRKIHVAAYLDTLERLFKQPHEEFIKTLMDLAGIEGRKTSRLIEEHTPIVAEAINILFDKKLLERVGFANRQDLVRVTETDAVPETSEEANREREIVEPPKSVDSGIVTTETELRVFDYVKYRLPFLIERDEDLFRKLDHIFMKDHKTVFVVSYKPERTGRLFNFQEGTAPKYRFEFTESNVSIDTDDLSDIDDELPGYLSTARRGARLEFEISF
ncbi:type I restriction endonuclease [soil metagenome]